MIIIGQKYEFTSLEIKEIESKFGSIDYIDCIDREVYEIIDEVKVYLGDKTECMVVLNVPKTLFDSILVELDKLSIELEILNIALFLNIHLQKCYLDDINVKNHIVESIEGFSGFNYFLKRVIDFVGVSFIALFSMPVMLYSIYRISKESPEGGVIYSQKRIGLNDEEFTCYKFRSMSVDAEGDTPQFASKDDERTFPWGGVMRKARFDELPQMWNVIKGDMHLIGPRPERKYWVDRFEKVIPYYRKRHSVRPGITGWAQVKYPYGEDEEDAKHKLSYDLYYIKRWSFIFEFIVVWKTVFVVIGKRGL